MLNKFFNKEKDYHQIFLEELYKKELDQNILRDLIFTNKVDINFQDNDQDS
ncbi:MAG: hypothetical protein U9O56_08030 [Campylobacterota bacterium]|nr:hypothetical protein [Campylobacterota bacterium]